jgi:hypothetical protein
MILVAEAAPAASQPVPPSISTECPALRRETLLREDDHAHLHDRKHVPPAEQACRLAIEDDDWSGEKLDYDTAGETYVSGMWRGADAAYRGVTVPIPSPFRETIQRGRPFRDIAWHSEGARPCEGSGGTGSLVLASTRTSRYRESRVRPRWHARSRLSRTRLHSTAVSPAISGTALARRLHALSETQQDRCTAACRVWTRRLTGQRASRSPIALRRWGTCAPEPRPAGDHRNGRSGGAKRCAGFSTSITRACRRAPSMLGAAASGAILGSVDWECPVCATVIVVGHR